MGFLKAFGSVWSRIGLGLASIGAVIVLLWPDDNWKLDGAELVSALTALALWVWAEITSVERPVSQHDLQLFEKFQNTYGPPAKSLLRDHDFGHSFFFKKTDGIFEIAHWDDASYEYVDGKLQEKWGAVQEESVEFTSLVAKNTGRVGGNSDLATVHPEQGDPDFPKAFVVERIDKLNTASQSLYEKLEEFERLARRRLKL